MIVKFILWSVASGTEIGTLGFAGAYRSVIVFSSFKVYQNGEISEIKSELVTALGRPFFIP
jgi:hypothetical protein